MRTSELEKLLYTVSDIEELLQYSSNVTYMEYMSHLMRKYNVSRSYIVQECGLARRAAYKIISGENKAANKDRIYRVALSIGVTREECEHLLALGNAGGFYIQNPRDMILIKGLLLHKRVIEVDLMLESLGFEPLAGGIK